MLQVRGQQVLLDRDVAALYGVETRVINQAVKNNPDKFPAGYVVKYVGTRPSGIYGDRPSGSVFWHDGVQAHPGDRGMQEIADRILKAFFPTPPGRVSNMR